MRRIASIAATAVGLMIVVGCSGEGRYELEQQVSMTMPVTLSGVDENGFLDVSHTCEGADTPPAISWSGAPAGTQSIALVVEDVDISEDFDFKGEEGATFAHWVVYAMPADTVELAGPLPSGSRMGINGLEHMRYSGPCPAPYVVSNTRGRPPRDPAHTYVFTVYALDSEVALEAGETRDGLLKTIDGIILAAGQATAEFQTTRIINSLAGSSTPTPAPQ